jgi:hypothetical protein
MPIHHIPLEAIALADIQSLIDNGEGEDRRLDFKLEVYGNSDKDKDELCSDVSAFANALGGDIVIGVQEKKDAAGKNTGLPDAVLGLPGLNIDETSRRLEQTLTGKVTPRLANVHVREIAGGATGPLLVIRVPRSWRMPHLVKHNDWLKCYVRRGASKGDPLDVQQLRDAFLLSARLPERIRKFRDDRLKQIKAGQFPALVFSSSKVVIHAFSIPVFEGGSPLSLDVTNLNPVNCPRLVQDQFLKRTRMSRFDLNGYLIAENELDIYKRDTCDEDASPVPAGYVQVYRDGVVEAVGSLDDRSPKYLSKGIGTSLARYVQDLLKHLERDGFAAPAFVMISLLGVSNRCLSPPDNQSNVPVGTNLPFDHEDLPLPEVQLDTFDGDSVALIRPALDTLWQAGGWASYFEP